MTWDVHHADARLVNKGYTDGAQTAWLDRRLGELRARPEIDFVVVFFHHCMYSTSTHASDGGPRDAWLPLFTQHQVDLVINGHNHVYERTDAVKGGEVGKPVPIGATTDPTRDGIVYVTAGGAGVDLYGFGLGVEDSYEGQVHDHDHIVTLTGRSCDRPTRLCLIQTWSSGRACATPASPFSRSRRSPVRTHG